MPELEDQLTLLGDAIAWPATPRIRVLPVFGEVVRSVTPVAVPRRIPRWALAAAAVLLIVAALAFTWLGLHTTIYRVTNPPTPTPHSPGTLGSSLGLGTPTTLAGAQGKVSWKVAVPSSLGRPDAVYLNLPPGGPSQGEVSLVYAQAPDIAASAQTGVAILVSEARGSVNENFFGKVLGPDTRIEQVTVNGHPGYWISGHPHDFAFTDSNGNFYNEQLRLATNTLVFDDNGTVVRIEGDMTKAQAVQIASATT
jgi:hypothetical protein